MVAELSNKSAEELAATSQLLAHARPTVMQDMVGLWALRDLIGIMVHRDLLGRYKGSLMGAFWPVINPLGHLLLYTFVFNLVLHVRFGNDASTANFALYLMTGLLPWGAFSEAIARSPISILATPNLVKRVVFPTQILPLVIVFSSALSQILALALLLVAAVVYSHSVPTALIYLPLVLFSQILFTAGLAWLLASLGVFIRDLGHAIALGLSVWMYATPIVYPAASLPDNFKFLLWANPMSGIVSDYRRIILQNLPPDFTSYAVYTVAGIIMWFVGFSFFAKTKRSFADVM
jgi:lipopolysaccharide transport system permease protein